MCKSTLITTLLVLVISNVPVTGQEGRAYKNYQNARFDYSIAYPTNLLIPQGEAENGDGQKFLSRDGRAEMLVYGSNNALDKTLQQAYSEEAEKTTEHPNRTITYHVIRPGWFVVSGMENGRVFYQKTILRKDVFKTFRIEYDENQKQIFDSVTAKIAQSFKG